VVIGKDHRTARMLTQPVQYGGKISVTRKDNELIEVGVMMHIVAHIHDHADIGRIFELRSQGRAIDNLKTRAQKMMAHERERRHVG
jgi:hypothetical protein